MCTKVPQYRINSSHSLSKSSVETLGGELMTSLTASNPNLLQSPHHLKQIWLTPKTHKDPRDNPAHTCTHYKSTPTPETPQRIFRQVAHSMFQLEPALMPSKAKYIKQPYPWARTAVRTKDAPESRTSVIIYHSSIITFITLLSYGGKSGRSKQEPKPTTFNMTIDLVPKTVAILVNCALGRSRERKLWQVKLRFVKTVND